LIFLGYMSKPRKDEPLKQPAYRGGEAALKKFVADNLQYPPQALENKIEGVVKAKYDVDSLGKIRNIQITESLGFGCDEEVIRLISLLKYEKAFNKGRNVTLHRSLKVDFKLPKEKLKNQTQIKYQLVSGKKKSEEAKKESDKINYIIKF